MSAWAIEVRGLRKEYRTTVTGGRIMALDGIDLSVQAGELFGLLGPNGAGKTTTVKILLGLTRPSDGQAFVSGLPVSDPESRRSVGYLPEGHKIPNYLTARQALSIFGRMSGLDAPTIKRRSVELLEALRIADWIDVRVKKFSKGMTQRLGLAIALIHSPKVLLLDELSVVDLQQLNAFVDQIRAGGALVSELAPLRSTLEDVFVDLVRA